MVGRWYGAVVGGMRLVRGDGIVSVSRRLNM